MHVDSPDLETMDTPEPAEEFCLIVIPPGVIKDEFTQSVKLSGVHAVGRCMSTTADTQSLITQGNTHTHTHSHTHDLMQTP